MKAKLIDPGKLQWDAERQVFTYLPDAVVGEVPWNPSSPPPASVAPQEWMTKETFAGWSLYEGDGELIISNLSKSSVEYIADLFNSRLREDKKEIERLRRRLEDREKAWRQFELERSELDVWKSHVRGSNEKAATLSTQLTVAREALEKLYGLAQKRILVAATQFDGSIEWQNRKTIEKVLAQVTSALSSITKQDLGIKETDVSTYHPSPTESPSIPEHGDVIP